MASGTESHTKDVRIKVLTEKAKEEWVQRLKDQKSSALRNVTRCKNAIVGLMNSTENLHLVKDSQDNLSSLMEQYKSASESYCDYLEPDSTPWENETKNFDEKQLKFIEFTNQLNDWIRGAERSLYDQTDSATVHSHGSRSRRSVTSRSSRSANSSISASAREKARIAELEVEKSLLHKKQDIKYLEDNLRLESEIAKAKAREKIFAQEESMNDPSDDKPVPFITQLPQSQAPDVQPGHHEPTTQLKPLAFGVTGGAPALLGPMQPLTPSALTDGHGQTALTQLVSFCLQPRLTHFGRLLAPGRVDHLLALHDASIKRTGLLARSVTKG